MSHPKSEIYIDLINIDLLCLPPGLLKSTKINHCMRNVTFYVTHNSLDGCFGTISERILLFFGIHVAICNIIPYLKTELQSKL